MSVMNKKVLATNIERIRGNSVQTRNEIQEVLISCAFYAMKDGNITPFNQLLDACREGRVTLKGVTMWAETFAPVYVKNDEFAYSKNAAKALHVTDEADFAPYEAEMRQVRWYEIVGPEKAESIWDAGDYLESVAKKLEKKGVLSNVVELVREAEMAARLNAARLEAEADTEGGEVPQLKVA